MCSGIHLLSDKPHLMMLVMMTDVDDDNDDDGNYCTHQVLAMGSLRLCVQFSVVIVNLVRPVAPTRLEKPPSGTLEL